eukprot:Gregarina_sp_Poly_1__4937@NODE_261_length_10458_cov_187_060244_g228_i0_p13_GENE_NODE_261_length_10458_cov_187_060244_g228_i0NODE_261_length_10458_cov_187_060244_g228_i0_p13_ORF_typecomplete_len108_score13_24_NODE_261_length_10458_cov_187_060244_g228_i021032426
MRRRTRTSRDSLRFLSCHLGSETLSEISTVLDSSMEECCLWTLKDSRDASEESFRKREELDPDAVGSKRTEERSLVGVSSASSTSKACNSAKLNLANPVGFRPFRRA